VLTGSAEIDDFVHGHQKSMANDSFAPSRTCEDDDDPAASSLIGTKAKIKGDA
jgi:hypothetical protein